MVSHKQGARLRASMRSVARADALGHPVLLDLVTNNL